MSSTQSSETAHRFRSFFIINWGTEPKKSLFFYSWFLLAMQIAAFCILGEIQPNLSTAILFGIADSFIILTPYFLLAPSWRRTLIVPLILTPAFLYANLLYLRNFGDLMGLSVMTDFRQANGGVAQGAFNSVFAADLWIGIPFLLSILLYILLIGKASRKSAAVRNSFRSSTKLIIVALAIILFCLTQIYSEGEYRRLRSPEFIERNKIRDSENILYRKLAKSRRAVQFRFFGFPAYLTYQLTEFLKPRYTKLSKSQLAEIERFIRFRQIPGDSLAPDSRNLIFIVVESFNSDLLDLHVGKRAAMPFLDSVMRADSVIFFPHILSQASIGRSSDGRFIYQTGLLPLHDDPVALEYNRARYPSIASALGRKSIEFDSGYAGQWKKEQLSKAYGFDSIYTAETMLRDMRHSGGKDGALFRNAMPYIRKLPQPFYIALNTMDMHDPYVTYIGKHTDASNAPELSPEERIYVEKARQFDRALSRFIASLKASGLYDNSIIVMAGDHNARESFLVGSNFPNRFIPLIILNSGRELRSGEVAGQVDIYPTLLSLMGVKNGNWPGLGRDLLKSAPETRIAPLASDTLSVQPYAYPSPAAWRMSENIIRTGFFR